MTARLVALALLIAAGALVIEGRLFWLQVVRGAQYAQQVDQSRVIAEVLPPRRGRILDRSGAAIADSRPVYDLAVVFAELELQGRPRREAVFWRLDQRAFDALAAELAARVRLPAGPDGAPASARDLLAAALSGHPAVAERSIRLAAGAPLVLLAVPRAALDPRLGEEDDALAGGTALLAEGGLLGEDPRGALERELQLRRGLAARVLSEAEFLAAAGRLDAAFAMRAGQCAGVLDAFAAPFAIALPEAGAQRLRLLPDDALPALRDALSRLVDRDPALVEEQVARALAGSRQPPPPGGLLWAAGADGEAIAPRLPRDRPMREVALAGVPGARERVWLIQGDPLDGEGLYSQLVRRLAADLGLSAVDLQALIETAAVPRSAAACEREFRVRQLALDAGRVEALAAGLTARLTALGRPADRLAIDALLAQARRTADRAWRGQTRNDPIPVVEDIPHPMAVRLQGRSGEPPRELRRAYPDAVAELPGLAVVENVGRRHPYPGSASHLIGLIGRDGGDPAQPARGRWGLERIYDEVLRGLPGARVRARTPEGVHLLREDPAVDGADLVTELDMELQTLAEDSLERYLDLAEAEGCQTPRMVAGRERGLGRAGFVLMDCHSGGLLAIASTPGYRLEDLRTRYQELVRDPSQPLIDHAAVADQPSGSTMKIATALACLRYGAVQPDESIWCQGYMARYHGRPVLRDHAPAGHYDLITAIQMSSNVYFATIGARLGPERLAETAGLLGLGRNNALDVPDQRPGILPTPDTLARLRPQEPKWLPSDTWRMAIGQFSTASPLQTVCVAAAVANGGYVLRPYLVRPPSQPVARDLAIRREWLDQVRRGMEKATAQEAHATARLLVLEGAATGIKVAAKTGTAEWGDKRFDHAWLIGYAPADNPTVAFACFINCGTSGGLACTPVAKRVLEAYFAKYGRSGHAEAIRLPSRPVVVPPAEEEVGG